LRHAKETLVAAGLMVQVPVGGGCDRSIAVNTGSLTAVNLDMSCLRSINWRPGATIWLLHGYA